MDPVRLSSTAECQLEDLVETLTMNDSVRSGIPVSLTQASMTPWISAVMVEPERKRWRWSVAQRAVIGGGGRRLGATFHLTYQ